MDSVIHYLGSLPAIQQKLFIAVCWNKLILCPKEFAESKSRISEINERYDKEHKKLFGE